MLTRESCAASFRSLSGYAGPTIRIEILNVAINWLGSTFSLNYRSVATVFLLTLSLFVERGFFQAFLLRRAAAPQGFVPRGRLLLRFVVIVLTFTFWPNCCFHFFFWRNLDTVGLRAPKKPEARQSFLRALSTHEISSLTNQPRPRTPMIEQPTALLPLP